MAKKKKRTVVITTHHVVSRRSTDQKNKSRERLFNAAHPQDLSFNSNTTLLPSRRIPSPKSRRTPSPNGPGKRRMAQAAPNSQRALSILRAPLRTIFQVILLSVGNCPPQSEESGEKEMRLTDEPIDGKFPIPANGHFPLSSTILPVRVLICFQDLRTERPDLDASAGRLAFALPCYISRDRYGSPER